MSFQPNADDTPVDLTAGGTGSSRGASRFDWSDPSHRPRLILAGIAGVLAVIVVLLLATRGGEPSLTPTPTPADLNAWPLSVSIKGATFQIVPVSVSDGRWRITNAGAESAEWIYGTVVNYVIGLYPGDATTELIDGLVTGDPVMLKMSNGADLNFQVSDRKRVPADAVAELFEQSRPGITLVVLGEGGEERFAISGLYDVDRESTTIGATGLVRVGEQVELGNWRVIVLSGQLAADTANPTQAYYYVNFTVEYLGADPISADTFDVRLIDGVRVEYIIDREVSSNGAYDPPGGPIAPHNRTSFTAGYRVAANVPGPSLVWVFKPTPDETHPARFEVPLVKPTPTPAPITQITAQVNGASLNEDQTLLVINGGVSNPNPQTVTIGQVDVSLSTPDNVFSDLRGVEPPLPWVIEPEQTLAFRLQFTRPPGFTAILRIVALQFELSGLR